MNTTAPESESIGKIKINITYLFNYKDIGFLFLWYDKSIEKANFLPLLPAVYGATIIKKKIISEWRKTVLGKLEQLLTKSMKGAVFFFWVNWYHSGQ